MVAEAEVALVSRDLGWPAKRLADRVTVLRDGAQVGTRRVAETTSAELVQMMVGRRIESLFPKIAAPIGRAANPTNCVPYDSRIPV